MGNKPLKGKASERGTPLTVSERMSRIRSKDTHPEIVVRRLLYGMGYRYRLNVKSLPGKPDIVFLGRRKIIFVHGCFWHQHHGCKVAHLPKSNIEFWRDKLERNRTRDEWVIAELQNQGWQTLVVWECELPDAKNLKKQLTHFLGPANAKASLHTI